MQRGKNRQITKSKRYKKRKKDEMPKAGPSRVSCYLTSWQSRKEKAIWWLSFLYKNARVFGPKSIQIKWVLK